MQNKTILDIIEQVRELVAKNDIKGARIVYKASQEQLDQYLNAFKHFRIDGVTEYKWYNKLFLKLKYDGGTFATFNQLKMAWYSTKWQKWTIVYRPLLKKEVSKTNKEDEKIQLIGVKWYFVFEKLEKNKIIKQ